MPRTSALAVSHLLQAQPHPLTARTEQRAMSRKHQAAGSEHQRACVASFLTCNCDYTDYAIGDVYATIDRDDGADDLVAVPVVTIRARAILPGHRDLSGSVTIATDLQRRREGRTTPPKSSTIHARQAVN